MADFSENIVNRRFREVFTTLERHNIIRGKSDIAGKLDTYNHVINSILKGKRNITVEQLTKLCNFYHVDANYMFGLCEEMFREGEMPLPSMMSLTKPEQVFGIKGNITLVNERVRAGYALSHQNPEYFKELPRFSIPGMESKPLVAFEITGDSMMPTITQGDYVVCEALERHQPIYDNHIYVVVTDVLVVKRVQQIKEGHQLKELRLISDNHDVYHPYAVPAQEVQQLLKVKCRLTTYAIG